MPVTSIDRWPPLKVVFVVKAVDKEVTMLAAVVNSCNIWTYRTASRLSSIQDGTMTINYFTRQYSRTLLEMPRRWRVL